MANVQRRITLRDGRVWIVRWTNDEEGQMDLRSLGLEAKLPKLHITARPRPYRICLEGDFGFGFYFGLVDFVAEAGFVGDCEVAVV